MSHAHPAKGIPATHEIPRIPTDGADEIVFGNPWEAKAFALVVHLYQQGRFSWPEWVEQLAGEIKASGSADDGSGYYLLWLSAAEKLVAAKSLCADPELRARKAALQAAQGGPLDSHT